MDFYIVLAVDADAGVILDAQIDVLLDAEPEIAGVGEVALAQLVLTHLRATLKDLLSLGSTHSAVDSDLLVPTDTKGSHSVTGLGVDGLLASQLLQHLGGTGQTIAGLAHADVQAQLPDAQLTHRVLLAFGILAILFVRHVACL